MLKAGYIAIIGRPNSGKSTLLNSILNTKISIVTPKAQTTRERVLGILTENERQIVFIDTPGIHRAKKGGINEYMMNEVEEALDTPNLIWYLVDPNSALEHEKAVLELLKKVHAPIFLVMNKSDIWGKSNRKTKVSSSAEVSQLESILISNLQGQGSEFRKVFRVSGLLKTEIPQLIQESWSYIPEGPFFYPDAEQASDRPTRFFVAEKIREQLFYLLGEEVPYSCAVEITDFKENTQPPRIEAAIYVERESQKGIVIGQGGKKIKEIGQSARKEIEDFLDQKIFLGLKVKVLKDWSQNPFDLKQMGYALPTERRKS